MKLQEKIYRVLNLNRFCRSIEGVPSQPEPWDCPNCGKIVDNGSRKCPYCGHCI